MEDNLLTLQEVSAYLGIPKSTIYKLSQVGELPSCKIGKQLRFRKSSLEQWLNNKESKDKDVGDDSLVIRNKKSVGGKPKSILLIDDDPHVLKAITKFLKMHSYNVVSVKNGKEALEEVKKTKFDLIIADIRMPELDGIETIKIIRAYCEGHNQPRIPEIIITGYADQEAERRAEELGIADRIYKPFLINEFMKSLENQLRKGSGGCS